MPMKTHHIVADNIDGVINSLEKASKILFKWFNDNLMKINVDKCHMLVSKNNTIKIKIGNFDITNSKSEKLLEVKFDHQLSFDDHISELCKKASRKIHALSREASFVSVHNRNLQILATEMYKIKNVLSALIVTELFEQRNEQHYDLRRNS